ncbi:MAG: phosphorylase [Holophaga sp.]|nr:phosphorylase [Holophaga sp.]
MNLLLSAFPPELGDLLDSPPPGWVVACTGIGAIEAAVTTARLLAQHRPARVLFLGTCGAYDDRLAVGAILSASEAIAISISELRGTAFRPQAERTRWASSWPLPFPAHSVAVPPAITRDPNEAKLLATIAPAEHLELTGVFAACQADRIPVAAALVVANRVGPEAHAEWLRNHARVSRELVAAIRDYLAH